MNATSASHSSERRHASQQPLAGAARIAVALIALGNGIGAVAGGVGLLRDAEGMGYKTAWLRGPFSDYTVPGLFLLIVLGGGLLVVAGVALARRPSAAPAALLMGLVLLAWLVIETAVIGYRGPIQIGFLLGCGASGIALAWIGARHMRGDHDA